METRPEFPARVRFAQSRFALSGPMLQTRRHHQSPMRPRAGMGCFPRRCLSAGKTLRAVSQTPYGHDSRRGFLHIWRTGPLHPRHRLTTSTPGSLQKCLWNSCCRIEGLVAGLTALAHSKLRQMEHVTPPKRWKALQSCFKTQITPELHC